ncbi:phytoene desaturase family protein [Desulfogranum japonicum]|uniref:phytoene desaturase family protein n=1 Tax=Desulfogranum japonicum TaxID=231447 RepID=UPI000412AD8F|nr:FAD-dependent oxidoreductase [Desulfogranum japonicum]
MADYQLLIIGCGLSGIAAGIRAARFGVKTLIVEQHALPGGLNSYYYRQGRFFETGLHAMTNFASPGDKRAPLNLLFRQLKLSRKTFKANQQNHSLVQFPSALLRFSNDPALLEEEIAQTFPEAIDRFRVLKKNICEYDSFSVKPWKSAKAFLKQHLENELLEHMLLLPTMIYGNAEEDDMDLGQFTIMFRAIFQEGFFRPEGTIKDFLQLLLQQFEQFGGEIWYKKPVEGIEHDHNRVHRLRFADGSTVSADHIVSTVGLPETIRLTGWQTDMQQYVGQMSFMETLSVLRSDTTVSSRERETIIFYSHSDSFHYRRPTALFEPQWGVICFPDNFQGLPVKTEPQVRVTNAANYQHWCVMSESEYEEQKKRCAQEAVVSAGKIIGPYEQDIIFQDSFTPLTIERFTRKKGGAIYGSPVKLATGATPWENLYIAGTDQGYLGIVGSMLSGVSMVNAHVL